MHDLMSASLHGAEPKQQHNTAANLSLSLSISSFPCCLFVSHFKFSKGEKCLRLNVKYENELQMPDLFKKIIDKKWLDFKKEKEKRNNSRTNLQLWTSFVWYKCILQH